MKLSVLIVIIIAFCFDFYLRKYNVYLLAEQIPSGTFVDYLLYIFAGMKEYLPTDEEGFIFPIRWSLLHLYIFYCTLHYPSKDLTSVGVNILLRTKGRTSWWLSKSIWNICYVLAVYLLIFLTVMLFCLVMKEPIHLDITAMFMNDILEAKSPYETFSTNLIWITLFFPLLFSIGMNLWQMTLTLFFKPLYSFGASAVILLASAYFFHPLFSRESRNANSKCVCSRKRLFD